MDTLDSKPCVVISKVGSVFYTREFAARNSKVGEQGETEGVIKHLLSRGDLRVVYFGQYRGDVPAGLTVVQSCLVDRDGNALNHDSTAADQKWAWYQDAVAVRGFHPRAFIGVTGYASTMSMIDNPTGATVQAAAIRYVAPALNVMQALKLPRIAINNDPRNYPQEGEMCYDWDHVRPIAVLSQRTSEWDWKSRGSKWRCREVYAGAENWCEHIQLPERFDKTVPCTVVAHAHIKDGCRYRKRDDAWLRVLAPRDDVETLRLLGMRVYGKGWEHYSGYVPDLMPGAIRPDEVMQVLARAKTCPAVAAGDNFYTGKLRTCLAQDCLPLFYGRGQPFTFDPLEKYIQLHSPCRVNDPGDLLKQVLYWDSHEADRRNVTQYLWDASKPNWRLLDDCINDLLAGADTSTQAWWDRYGSYRRR